MQQASKPVFLLGAEFHCPILQLHLNRASIFRYPEGRLSAARTLRRLVKRLITPPLFVVVTAVLLVEEVLWRLSAVVGWVARLPVLRSVERLIAGLPPYPALACFLLPAAALAPIKFLAFYWLAGGHPALGISTIAFAKVTGTALVARIFQLTKGSLLTVGWFRWCFESFVAGRAALYQWWRESAVGRWMIARLHRMERTAPGWLARRWAAIRSRMNRGNSAEAMRSDR